MVLIEGTHLLVDNSTTELSKLLRFEQRPYGAPLDDALYVEPSLSGSAVIPPTKGREETPINLELLFNAIVQYPDLLHQAEAANNGTIASF